jgi:hypothetical protein
MAGKLIPLAEAAEMLGISAEELTEKRSRGEIHGYRDGASWKFKDIEIARVAADLGGGLGDLSGEDSMAALDDGESTFEGSLGDVDLDADLIEGSSILVSDAPKGPVSGASSIIGGDNAESDGDSDIKLAGDSDLKLEASDIQLAGSDIGLDEGGSGSHDSDVALAADDQGSDVKLVAGDSGSFATGDSDFVTDSDVLAEDSGDMKVSTGDTGRLSDSDLALSEADEALESTSGDSLALGDDDLLLDEESAIGTGSHSSALDLDDDEMVLGGSGIGSDVTLGTGDSGIGLANPSESGLDLEDATLDLGGSAVESLELPEDDDDDVIALEEQADPDAATQLKADDEFLLTPVEGDDEEDESGSQVIALEDSGAYDADAATLLGGAAEQPLVAEESDMFGQQLDAYNQAGGPGAAQPMPMHAPMPMAAAGPPETPYSILQVLSLMVVMMILLVAGLMMVDLVNNMWEFQEVGDAQTAIMDAVVGAFFGNN